MTMAVPDQKAVASRALVAPQLSVIIPTFRNLAVLRECLASWQTHCADLPVELIVIEDGECDETAAFLDQLAETQSGRGRIRWFREPNVHELRCTNRGFREASAPLLMTWQDDMFVRSSELVRELTRLFDLYPDIGLISLSRGLRLHPVDAPIQTWEDLVDSRRLESTIGPPVWNWFYLEEVDTVIRPWAVRRACLDEVGFLDEAFVPTEWDEADLCYRIRRAGWKVATHGYERLGLYKHLGSSTLRMSDAYKERVLRNGQTFHARWSETIAKEAGLPRRRWRRPARSVWAAGTFRVMTSRLLSGASR